MLSQKTPYELVPQLGRLRDEVVYDNVWEQPELSKRDRSLITISALMALYRTPELRGHLRRAANDHAAQASDRAPSTLRW